MSEASVKSSSRFSRKRATIFAVLAIFLVGGSAGLVASIRASLATTTALHHASVPEYASMFGSNAHQWSTSVRWIPCYMASMLWGVVAPPAHLYGFPPRPERPSNLRLLL